MLQFGFHCNKPHPLSQVCIWPQIARGNWFLSSDAQHCGYCEDSSRALRNQVHRTSVYIYVNSIFVWLRTRWTALHNILFSFMNSMYWRQQWAHAFINYVTEKCAKKKKHKTICTLSVCLHCFFYVNKDGENSKQTELLYSSAIS